MLFSTSTDCLELKERQREMRGGVGEDVAKTCRLKFWKDADAKCGGEAAAPKLGTVDATYPLTLTSSIAWTSSSSLVDLR